MTEPRSFASLLRARAAEQPDVAAYVFLHDGVEEPVTYRELDRRAGALAARFLRHAEPGARALLLCSPGRAYVEAFFGCLYAGLVAVPAYPPAGPRDAERVAGIARDCDPALGIVDSSAAASAPGGPAGQLTRNLVWSSAEAPPADAERIYAPAEEADQVAFLQYTSGSTGDPRGVVLSHANLVHNAAVLGRRLGLRPQDRTVSWLPPYHDMGLIGGILQPVYSGFPGLLMTPSAFLRDPAAWLRAISRSRATVCAAPTFAYAECVRRVPEEVRDTLDLSSWRCALVGAEPVRADVLADFSRHFAGAGFDGSAFYPCYGLAEATLFVTGAEPGRGARATAVSTRSLAAGRAVALPDPADRLPPGPGEPAGDRTLLVSSGRARDADTVLVVDPRTRRPAAPGSVGEIWVSGPTVAQGYWGRPEETEQVFRASLADREPPFLRTGDLGFEHAGELYIAGRSKDVILVRGRNVYPQDLEATAQRAHPGLRPNRLTAFGVTGAEGTEQVVLVAEVTGAAGRDHGAVIDAVRSAVAAEHSVSLDDVVLVTGGGVPRTSSGKVRRSACKERYLTGQLPRLASLRSPGDTATGPAAPAPAVLELIAAVLGLGRASELRLDTSLVAQGLDSLRAAELTARLASECGIALPLAELFGSEPLDDLLRAATEQQPGGEPPLGAGTHHDHDTAAPTGAAGTRAATEGEQRLFTLNQLGAAAAYHLAGGVRLRGRLDVDALESALGEVRRRNPALRATFALERTPTGPAVLRRVVHPWSEQLPEPVELVGGSAAEHAQALAAWQRDLALRPFDLEREPPFRYGLARLGDDEYLLCAVFHHIAVDGRSVRLISRQLEQGYEAALSGVPAAPAAAGAGPAARTPGGTGSTAEAGLEFWLRTLDGVPDLDLRTDHPRPARHSYAGATLPLSLTPELLDGVRGLAQAEGATPFMVLLAALAVVLGRNSRQQRFVVGVPYSSTTPDDDEVGYAVNLLPLVADLSAASTFRGLLARLRAHALAGYAHADTPFERIVHERARLTGDRQESLVRAMLAVNGRGLEPWNQRGLIAEPFESALPAAMCDLSVHLNESADGLTGHLSYATALFDEDSARGLRASLLGTLRAAVADPGVRLAEVASAHGAERESVLGELSGASEPPVFDGCVDALFERRAAATPDATAVVFDGSALTFGELDAEADRLARHLRDRGVRPGSVVAVHLRRSLSLPVALLAVLKAGAAYLPLDPQLPAERLAAVIEDARPALVLTSSATLGSADAPPLWHGGETHTGVPVLDLEAEADAIARRRPERLPATSSAGAPAYVIYTSGSTGTPKGVVNTHRGLANYLAQLTRLLGPEAGDGLLQNTPIGFDVSVGELLWPLVSGLRLVLPRTSRLYEPGYLADLITRERVRVCLFVPSVLRHFLADPSAPTCAATLRDVVTLGEVLPAGLAVRFQQMFPRCRLHNHYGPAETAIICVAHQLEPGFGGARVPIGRPLPGVRAYVLDEALEPVPVGASGELYLAGDCLSIGYLGRPGPTAAVYLPNPFGTGDRIYRTGDVVRWRPDGNLEYLGRADRQLKIRGQRVEPGDVEHALTVHPAVVAAAVRAAPDGRGGPGLAAYLVCRQPVPTPADLRAHLASRLPRYMVPSDFVLLPELPLGANGKVSYADLPDPVRDLLREPGEARRGAAPSTPVEQELATIFTRVLDVESVGVDDDFYELGGHSLLALQIVAAVRERFHVTLDVGDLLVRHTTVAGLGQFVLDRQLTQARPDDLRAALARISTLSEEEVAALMPDGTAAGRAADAESPAPQPDPARAGRAWRHAGGESDSA